MVDGYPTNDDPIVAFIKPIVHAIADQGYRCTVIAPQSLTNTVKQHKKIRKELWKDVTEKGNIITIVQPKTITGSTATKKLNNLICFHACKNAIKKNNISPDIVYAHFWNNGVLASRILDAPIVVAAGESRIWVRDRYSSKEIDAALKKIKGVISVSTENITKSQNEGLLKEQPETIVLPNAVDPHEFFNFSKEKARKGLNIEQDSFVVSFVGAFIERKGINRLLQAISGHEDIKAILIGKGSDIKINSQILFSGSVSHEKIVDYLNASDVFVLPTNAEGCCNAIIEAMACGLPIISSNQKFNDDILDDKCSIRIDPMDIKAIEDSIIMLKEDKANREMLGKGALEKAKTLTIEERAERIVSFFLRILEERA